MKLEEIEQLIAEFVVSMYFHVARRVDCGLASHGALLGDPLNQRERDEVMDIRQLKAKLKKASRLVDMKALTPMNITGARERFCETGALPKNTRLAMLVVRIEAALAQMALVNGLGEQAERDAHTRLKLLRVHRDRLHRQSCRMR